MIDEQRPGFHIDLGDRRQRHLAAARRRHVDRLQGIDGSVGGRIRLQDDAILIRLGEDGGDDALAEGIVQRVVDRADADAEARRAVAVDGDVGRESVVLLIADHVGELGLLAQAPPRASASRSTRPPASALSRVNWYWVRLTVLSRVRSCTGCMYSVTPAMPAVSPCSRRMTSATFGTALAARLQVDQEAAAVQSDIVAVDADERGQAQNIRILEYGGRQRLLPLGHGGVGDRLGRLRDALESGPCPARERSPSESECRESPSAPRCRSRRTGSGADDRAPRSVCVRTSRPWR